MKAYRIWAFIVAAVAVVAAVGVFRSPHPTEPVRSTDAGSSWTLFGGIGSTSDDKTVTTKFSVPTVKQYEGGAFDLENLTVVQFVEKYRSAAHGSGREAAYAAYRIYQAEKMCADSMETEGRLGLSRGSEQYANALGDEAEACVGLPPTWLYERYQFLKQAAQGGIEGAAIAFYEDGASGHMTGDPMPADWADDAIKLLQAAGEQGDMNALHRLSVIYHDQQDQLVPPDPQKALTYKTAMLVLQPSRGPGGAPLALEDTPIIKKLSAGLSSEQVAAALQEGRAIAAQCCEKN
jgi:hypothetical protein